MSRDDDYDLEAFNDGVKTGRVIGHRDAERDAVRTVAALVVAAGGSISVPVDLLGEQCGTLVRFDDVANGAVVFRCHDKTA